MHNAIYEEATLPTFQGRYVLWSGLHIIQDNNDSHLISGDIILFVTMGTVLNKLQGRDLIDARYWGLNHIGPWNTDEFDAWFKEFSEVLLNIISSMQEMIN